MKYIFNEFIRQVKQKTPEGHNTVDTLIGIIPMSKEAAYRRLRGEIDFSFGEVLKIAQEMNISLDELNNKENRKGFYTSRMSSIKENSFMEDCEKWQNTVYDLAHRLRIQNKHIATSINSNISILYLYRYELLSKFRLFKWLYQLNSQSRFLKLSEFEISPKLIRNEKAILKELQQTNLNFIYSKDLFVSIISQIKYFRELNLVNEKEFEQMKEELFSLLNDMEQDTIVGQNNSNPLSVYVSSMHIDNDFIFWESDDLSLITFRPFGVSFFLVDGKEIFEEMKTWIKMLMKSSTLISFSAEKQRIEFFQNQRKIIERLN